MKVIFFITLIMISCGTEKLHPPNRMEALAVAKRWFGHMDKGYFLKTYRDSSVVLKDKLSERGWKRSFLYKKMVFGIKQKRVKTRSELLYNLRSFPLGTYTEVDYDSYYSKRGNTRERLILRWERGMWRVCGYTVL